MILLTMPDCLACHELKGYLESCQVPFTEQKLTELGSEEYAELLATIRTSGYPGRAEDLLAAPILWNIQKGWAIPSNKIFDGAGQIRPLIHAVIKRMEKFA